MLGSKSRSWVYPRPTGDPGRDRNARTVQFTCFLLASAVSALLILNVISGEPSAETPILVFSVAALVAAMVTNRAGSWKWAAQTALLAVLLTAMLLVFEARDGFRSLAMLVFPGMLLISVMLLDRASYVTTAVMVLVAVAALGIAEKQGLTGAVPHVRSSTTYESIFFVDLNLLVFAMIGIRIAGDAQSNVFDLRATIGRVSKANLTLKETAEALRESEQELVSIYNTVRDAIFHLAVEPEGRFRFVSVSAAFLRVTGLSREAVIGKSVNEVIPEPSLTMVLGKYRQAIEEETTVVWEETSDYPTGRLTGEVSVAPVFDNKGNCTHLVGSVHDITERKRAEAALRESEVRLKNAERLAHVGHWTWDLKSNQVTWSEEMFHIFGHPQDYAPSYEEFFQALIPQDRERTRRELRNALVDHTGFSSEVQIARPNGDLRTTTFVSEVLLDEDGSLKAMFGAIQDITDLRRAQRADFARQKLESIGTFASGIAHDFNNLLGSVLLQAELALSELTDGSNPEEELKTIRTVAKRGAEIVRELMVYVGKESPTAKLVDVSRIVQEMLELLKVSVSKHAVLEANLGKNLPPIRVNAAQLRQIVMNLVANASDAVGDRDGVIRLSTRCVRLEQDSQLSHLDKGNYVLLEVTDTGCGMTPEMQAKVFDPFFTTKFAGHGLGLAIVDGIVRGLRGMIRLNSEPGKGTTFQILLPCDVSRAGGDDHTISCLDEKPEGQFQDLTVLIVEDEGPIRQAVTKMLRNTGFEVFEVADGSSAIDLLRANGGNIDLILLDMTIPGASSSEVVAEAGNVRPDIKVVLTSAYSQEMIADAMNAPQISGFIRKPFQLEDLLKKLPSNLRRLRPSADRS
jgi:PAS domain S-box-containing protein